MAYLLGIDLGTSGTKTLICDFKGRVLATGHVPHTVQSPKPGWSEQDPAQWWAACKKAVKQAIKRAGVKGQQITAIGLSGQMHGSVFVGKDADDQSEALRPALLWNDQRTQAQCDEITSKAGGPRKLIQAVGNPALTGFQAPKVLWVREHEPKVFNKTAYVLLPKDWLRLRLTGELATEMSDASGTLLLDVKKRKWNTALMRKLGLDPSLFPRCVESHEVTGQLTKRAASALGLSEGAVVVGGAGDQAAGAVGNGIVKRGIVSATLGTSGVVFAHSDEPVYDKEGRVHTMCSAVAGKWCVFGCMLSAAGSLQWFRDSLAPKVAFDKLVDEAAGVTAGSDGLMFLPYLTGERCPYPDPDARGAFIGLTSTHTRAHLARAVLEGVTFGMADQVRIMRDDMGVAMRSVRLSGGGAKSVFWRQLQADVYGTPVALTNASEGPAYGVALLAGVGTGVWKDVPEACAATIEQTETLKPAAKRKRFYAERHGVYASLYPALKDVFPALAV
ncbi:MAG: xylulokinase [Planctomycetota bacterium]